MINYASLASPEFWILKDLKFRAFQLPLCRSPGELWLKERIAAFDAGNRRKRKEAAKLKMLRTASSQQSLMHVISI